MTRERALEIVASHGADAARWPADERAALLALAVSDDAVAQALAEAQPLDAMLAGWAGDVPERRFEAEALLPAPVASASARRGVMRWAAAVAGGGAVAAALALAMIGLPDGGRSDMTEIASVYQGETDLAAPVSAGDAVDLDEGFAMFFTPTADEEDVI